MLEVKDLTKSYRDKEILKGVSFCCKRGSITALLGPNGAGKTTTLDIITAIKKANSGEVFIDEISTTKDDSFKENIGVMLQETKIYKKIRVKEALKLFASFYKSSTNTEMLLEKIGLKKLENSFFSTLSGGEKQKLFLGIALVNNPDLLILDEPTSALDPISKKEFWDILLSLKNEGKCILLSTHNLQEAEILADKIIMIKDGKIVADGTIDEVRNSLKWGKMLNLTVNPNFKESILRVLSKFEDIELKSTNNIIEIKCQNSSKIIKELFQNFENLDEYFINIELKSPPLEEVFFEVLS